MTYRRILLTLDGSRLADSAIVHARDLAQATGACIVLLDVLTTEWLHAPFGAASSRTAAHQAALQHLREVRDRLTADGVEHVEVVTLEGMDAAWAIADAAPRLECDAVVMATHGRAGVDRLLRGSVSEAVVRRLRDIPVLLVHPTAAA